MARLHRRARELLHAFLPLTGVVACDRQAPLVVAPVVDYSDAGVGSKIQTETYQETVIAFPERSLQHCAPHEREAAQKRCEPTEETSAAAHYAAPFERCKVSPDFNFEASTAAFRVKSNHCCYVTWRCLLIRRGRPLVDEAGKGTVASMRMTRKTKPRTRWWLDTAKAAHASVAAFARLAMELMAHGAPLSLVERTHAAALDEVRHARTALQEARVHDVDRAMGPLGMNISRPIPLLEQVGLEALLDGCIGEAASVLVLQERADKESRSERLNAIVLDETRHVALSWDIVAWVTEQLGSGFVPTLVQACDVARSRIERAIADQSAPEMLEELRAQLAVIDSVVAPVLRTFGPPKACDTDQAS